MDSRHAFQILEQLGPEADRLGIKVVDAYGQSGPVSEFLPKIIRYIEAREAEIDRLRLTNEEVDNIRFAAKRLDYSEGANMDSCTAAVLLLMLERLGHDSGKDLDE